MDELRPLKGARIWLSGSLSDGADGQTLENFTLFVKRLSELVFRGGGTILHGSHPSIVPALLATAEKHLANRGSRDALLLAASKLYEPKYSGDLPRWRAAAIVHEEPDVDKDREKSLARLRRWMADRCDAMIGIGGKWWKENRGIAGVPREFELAHERGLPCFLLGGLGGAAAEFLEQYREVLRNLRNGLNPVQNARLATEPDVEALAVQVYEQLCRLPLVRGETLGDSTFRILALDGGGIKGTFTAAVLAAWEAALEQEEREKAKRQDRVLEPVHLTDYFDLIAGTSTGGILALGLGMGLRAHDILTFYEQRGPIVFPVTSVRDDPVLNFGAAALTFVRRLRAPQYDQTVLRRELEEAFARTPRKRIGDAACRLVIPAVHARTGAVHQFCTDHHPDLVADRDKTPVEVALATAAAPTYFSAATVNDGAYLDGGLWANNPTLAALAEAVGRLHVPLNRIDILSVGTTSEPDPGSPLNGGFYAWLKGKRIISLLMYAQAQGTIVLANNLAGRARVLRVDQTLVPNRASLDDVEAIPLLKDCGLRAGENPDMLADVKARFLNGIKVESWR